MEILHSNRTSSHHIQRFEVHAGRPIVYGLGDFLFRHVVGVDDWCPLYADCASYRPDLSLAYVFQVKRSSVDGSVAIDLGNITAFATQHNKNRTGLISSATDSQWLVEKFGEISPGAKLEPASPNARFGQGRFHVRLR
jgi:poly-gamma-glutamate capsule biosynthesis protein CapA/YwtB (metallophosphatase superfamily)